MEKMYLMNESEFRADMGLIERIQLKLDFALKDKNGITRGDYISLVAEVLFVEFGNDRESREAEYIICEAMALAIASKSTPGGHFEQYEEKFMRDGIRSKLNILGE